MNGTLSKPFGLEILYKTLHDNLISLNTVVVPQDQVVEEELNEEDEVIDHTPRQQLTFLY
jgi:hypothetical protein